MFPPGPTAQITTAQITDYERDGYLAQLEFVADRVMIELLGGDALIWTMVGEQRESTPAQGVLLDNLRELHAALGPGRRAVVEGRMLPGWGEQRGIVIATDVLIAGGQSLHDASMLERYCMLAEVMGDTDEHEDLTGQRIAIGCRDKLWLGMTFSHNASAELRSRAGLSEVVGLLFKRPERTLADERMVDGRSPARVLCPKPR